MPLFLQFLGLDHIYLSNLLIYLSICLSIYLSTYLSNYLSIYAEVQAQRELQHFDELFERCYVVRMELRLGLLASGR